MGCKYYHAEGSIIHFSDAQDDVMCLCTFPGNDKNKLSIERIRSLAMLGATVALLHTGDIPKGNERYQYIPYCLPEWVVNEIKRLLPDELE